ncbi:MAG: serine/threonine-protein kinase [Myxococcota bacterium]
MVEDQPTPNGAQVPTSGRIALDPADRTPPDRTPPQGPSVGGGRYTLVSKIAEGGMAGVYRAWDHKMRVWRALKVLLPEFTQRDILRARFEGEAKTMARLDHPHVIRVYDVGTREALPYMVMELAEGGTVNGWVDLHGPMPARLAVDIVVQVADGLAAAHALEVVHRDVKPHNVLIAADGACKITDFGIAHGAVDSERTRTGATMGTIGYMAPEQRNDARTVDARADIYSLGATLYKMVVGKVVPDLFLAEHEPSLLEPVPELLREVVLRACFHDRGRRYPDAHTLIRALQEIRSLLPADPPDTPPLPLPAAAPMRQAIEGFPEIGPLLGMALPKQTPVPPLPYTMPRQRPAPRSAAQVPVHDEVPEWVERTPSLNTQDPALSGLGVPRAPTLSPDLEARRALAERRRGEPMFPPFVRGLMMATVLLWGITIGLTAVSSLDLHWRASRTQQAQEHLLQVIDVERALCTSCRRTSPPSHTHVLNELLDAVPRSKPGLARAHAIAAYLSGVRSEADAWLDRGLSQDLAMAWARNLDKAWIAYVRATTGSARPAGPRAGWPCASVSRPAPRY